MAPSEPQLRRTQNTLLLQKLLNVRDGASPLTVVLDSLEQKGGAIIEESVRRATMSKCHIVLISFATLVKEVKFEFDRFIAATGKTLAALTQEIRALLPSPAGSEPPQRTLLIIDTLNPLTQSTLLSHLPTFLSSLLIAPSISLLATYHTDVPTAAHTSASYNASPLTTLTYLATALLRVSSLRQVIAQKRAVSRSLQPPVFGLAEHREGVIMGVHSSPRPHQGPQSSSSQLEIVVEMEMRRKSGRGIVESFVLCIPSQRSTGGDQKIDALRKHDLARITLLDDHPLLVALASPASREDEEGQSDLEDLTFKLGLSEKERRDREDIVLPYFDAQQQGGGGEGGRILYDMGKEDWDDFDEEEDEI